MRKTKDITMPSGTRDAGKKFLITEMSARAAESWSMRAIMGMASSGISMPADAQENGALGIILYGLSGFMRMKAEDALPLFDEMMSCAQIYDQEHKAYRSLEEDDVEEVGTMLMLRAEVMELHTGFPVNAALLTLGAAVKEKLASEVSSQDTSTFPSTSGQSSAAG
jgi:hypothetical protein